MKFEAPRAEVRKFSVTDILTASEEVNPREGAWTPIADGHCYGTRQDFDEPSPNCFA